MINKNIYLIEDLSKAEMTPTRDGFGKGLVEAGAKDEKIVVLCADLAESTRCHWFKEKFPDRYIEIGVAEQNLAAVASGLANYGKIPFIASYAAFSPGRNNEQIRTLVSLSRLPVKICGGHAGVSVSAAARPIFVSAVKKHRYLRRKKRRLKSARRLFSGTLL
ncbi:MAG: Transketolase, central region [Candidatus Azambacteria bacterium GW2011_GWA2_42_62]|nr:MAG: Transketolase, central region [Candidatus Azambacteria bacterium GW2011_GWA2_42_62]